MRLRFLSLLLVAAVALAIAPFATSKPAATKKTLVAVTAKEFKFTLSKRSAPHGVVVFKITNKGKLPHDFKISGVKSKLVKPGTSTTLTVNLSKGSKPYLCTVPGHAAAG